MNTPPGSPVFCLTMGFSSYTSLAMPSLRRRPELWTLALILGGTLFRLAAGWQVGLGYGESYYFSGVIRPALSYFDHPPLTFWAGWLSVKLLGVGPLALRLPFILMFAGTCWLTFACARRLYNSWSGFYAVLLLNLSAVFTWSSGTFIQPDGPLMLFWMACFYCLIRILLDQARVRPLPWWSAAGGLLGLAMLAKYHAVFIPLGVFVFILTRPDQRRILATPGPYLALGLALLISSPVLIWNHEHGWISFLYQAGRGAENSGIRLDWLGRQILGQALSLLPWIFLPLAYEFYRTVRSGPRESRSWLAACLAFWPIFIFTAVSAYAPIGYHFHWQAPGWLTLFPLLGARTEEVFRSGPASQERWVRRWLWGSAIFTCLALALVFSQAKYGWATPAIKRLAPAQATADPTLELLDWGPLEKALEERGLLGRKDLFLFSNRWFSCGKIDYALKGRMPVVCFSHKDPRNFAFYDRPDNWMGRDGVLVVFEPYVYQPLVDYHIYFNKIEPLGQVGITRRGRVDLVLHLYYCRGLKKHYALPY